MKQNVKKSLILLLAVVMIVSMSVTAYAQPIVPNIDATVNFAVEGETYVTEEVSFDPDDFEHMFYIDPSANYAITLPTVLDAILQAYEQYNPGFGTAEVTYYWDIISNPAGIYIDRFDGLDPEVTSYTWYDIGNTRYYTMTGYAWMIEVNGSPISLYSSSVVLNDNDVVAISYNEYEENWTGPVPASK